MNRATLIILLLILGAMFSSFKIYKNDYEYGGFMKGFDASTVSQIEEHTKMQTVQPKTFSNS